MPARCLCKTDTAAPVPFSRHSPIQPAKAEVYSLPNSKQDAHLLLDTFCKLSIYHWMPKSVPDVTPRASPIWTDPTLGKLVYSSCVQSTRQAFSAFRHVCQHLRLLWPVVGRTYPICSGPLHFKGPPICFLPIFLSSQKHALSAQAKHNTTATHSGTHTRTQAYIKHTLRHPDAFCTLTTTVARPSTPSSTKNTQVRQPNNLRLDSQANS